jgi:hypothetical protein
MEKWTIAFRLKDTHGLLYHYANDPIECLNYIKWILDQHGFLKGLAYEKVEERNY